MDKAAAQKRIQELSAEIERPKRAVHQRSPVRACQRSQKCAGCRVESIDRAIAEIANQQVASKISETARGQRNAPWGEQSTAGREPLNEIS